MTATLGTKKKNVILPPFGEATYFHYEVSEMSHVVKLADSVIGQIKLANMLKQHKHYIGVYVARHNLNPVIDEICRQAGQYLGLTVSTRKELEEGLWKHYKIKIDIWQKPDPFEDRNHLTLTVGGLTAIIFDYGN